MAEHYLEVDPFDAQSVREANRELLWLLNEFENNVKRTQTDDVILCYSTDRIQPYKGNEKCSNSSNKPW